MIVFEFVLCTLYLWPWLHFVFCTCTKSSPPTFDTFCTKDFQQITSFLNGKLISGVPPIIYVRNILWSTEMAAVVVSVPNTCRPILSVSVLSHTPTDCMLICSDRFANTTKCYHCEHVYLHPPSLRRHNNILVLHILHEAIACMLIYREWFSNTYLLHKNQLWCIASIMQSQDTYIRLWRVGPSLAPTPVRR